VTFPPHQTYDSLPCLGHGNGSYKNEVESLRVVLHSLHFNKLCNSTHNDNVDITWTSRAMTIKEHQPWYVQNWTSPKAVMFQR